MSIAPLGAQVRVNEFMASNTRTYADITDFEDYPDWIELHNTGGTEASLNNYFLSDNPDRPFKWRIPNGAVIPANGYLVIVADGHDANIGERHQRDYWPNANFRTEKYHTSFSLSADGESVVLTSISGSAETALIDTGATWKYLDDGSAQTLPWRGRIYDDSAWASGPAPLGYGDDPATEISFGEDSDNKHTTSYFRHSFNVANPTDFDELTLSIQVDDAAVVYLNGNEIVRQNLREGEIDFQTFALESAAQPEEEYFTDYTFPAEFLVAGENVIAVEVHQNTNGSVDLRLDLSLKGLNFTDLVTHDSVTYSVQVSDVPMARSPLDSNLWVELDQATPGEANLGREVSDLRSTSGSLEMSPAGGLYPVSQIVTLSAYTGEIRFTLDGREPSPLDPVYTEPLSITEPTVVRARVYETGKVPGQIFTTTYLIGEEFNGMPVLSITAEPETLFGDEIGIYFNQHEPNQGVGPAVYKGKDAPGNLEMFMPDGSPGFSVNGGFRMGGENNWASHTQRALNFALRGKYGDDELKYDLFPGSGIPIFTSLTLREGGDDYGSARLRDGIFDAIGKDRLEVETNKLRTSAVFINGEYWGQYNIRDRWDENWLFQHYGTDNGEYDHIRFNDTSQGTPPVIENGSNESWNELFTFLRNNDLEDPANWAYVESRIDVDSFIDFVVAEGWSNNSSWTGNREAWKAHRPGSKWRWFIPDMDRTFQNSNGNTFQSMLGSEQFLRYLKDNTIFRHRLAQRFAVHLASTFSPARIHSLVDFFGNAAAPEIPRNDDRWSGAPSLSSYESSLQDMKDYATDRSSNVISDIEDQLNLDSAVDLTLATTGQGHLLVSGVPVDSGTLEIFPDIDTEIEAIPAPGFRFDSWNGIAATNSATSFNLSGNTSITANFVPSSAVAIGGTLSQNTTLSSTADSYFIEDDLIVPSGITLTLNEGVVLELAKYRNIRVMGTLVVAGSEASPVTIKGRSGESWGGISFEEPTTQSSLSHLVIRNASRGKNPIVYPSAISGLNADLDLEFLNIGKSRGPLFFRGGTTSLRDSIIDIPLTGDGLNIKKGAAETIRCTFTGSNSPDTDAIDYDGVIDGVIRDCRIYRFLGFNSDGIDTGEQCVNVLIEGNTIFHNSDKGVSVGQGSTVILRKNLIVGCPLGVGVKDFGSDILIDQNTFVGCDEAVAVFEKNFGGGGGSATVTNTIFSDCTLPATVDALSSLSVSYSLSDTIPLSGTGNQLGSPSFVDTASLNFELNPNSPAIDSGDPAHELDLDATRADMGAYYLYSPGDYPFTNSNTVVINEVLSNSGEETDWIEIHNRTLDAVDIGGWFLSDDLSQLAKYRISAGTIIPGNGYLIFYEDSNFGTTSIDPNKLEGFALSDTGETVYLSSAVDDQLSGYLFKEDFGPSQEGESIGYYFKSSSNSYNFVAQTAHSQAAPNYGPRVGPIVISEIMYHPGGDADSEYIELQNITESPVTLFDPAKGLAWRISNGIEFEFPSASPLTLTPGQRIILTRNANAFASEFSPPPGTLVFEWISGKLSNGGETIQLDKPGPMDSQGAYTYVRMDRVNYSPDLPWDVGADGTGLSLTKIVEVEYGNDFINWVATAPTPGTITSEARFSDWATDNGVTDPNADPDSDGLSNLMEYAFGTDPTTSTLVQPIGMRVNGLSIDLSFPASYLKPDLDIFLEASSDLEQWSQVTTTLQGDFRAISVPLEERVFYRLNMSQKP